MDAGTDLDGEIIITEKVSGAAFDYFTGTYPHEICRRLLKYLLVIG
jgi:hypothetical protein